MQVCGRSPINKPVSDGYMAHLQVPSLDLLPSQEGYSNTETDQNPQNFWYHPSHQLLNPIRFNSSATPNHDLLSLT